MATKKSNQKKPVSKETKNKSKKRMSKSQKILRSIIGVIVLIVALGWYFYGKPVIKINTDGKLIQLEQTERPLIFVYLDQIRGIEPEITEVQNEQPLPSQTTVAKKSTTPQEVNFEYSENHPMYLGNPSDATTDVSNDKNYLMDRSQFTMSYNNETLCPNWVGWHLSTDDFGDAERADNFRPDTDLPDGYYRVRKADYQFNAYGFDRGHVCPSADRTKTVEDNEMTFLMTNMVPQAPDSNRIVWKDLEAYERDLALEGNELYIFAGPVGSGGSGDKGSFDYIPIKTKSGQVYNMNVPEFTWKVVIVLPKGEDDFNRIDENTRIISVCIPNQKGVHKGGDWTAYQKPIDYIEEITGYDFFELLPDLIEDELEN